MLIRLRVAVRGPRVILTVTSEPKFKAAISSSDSPGYIAVLNEYLWKRATSFLPLGTHLIIASHIRVAVELTFDPLYR